MQIGLADIPESATRSNIADVAPEETADMAAATGDLPAEFTLVAEAAVLPAETGADDSSGPAVDSPPSPTNGSNLVTAISTSSEAPGHIMAVSVENAPADAVIRDVPAGSPALQNSENRLHAGQYTAKAAPESSISLPVLPQDKGDVATQSDTKPVANDKAILRAGSEPATPVPVQNRPMEKAVGWFDARVGQSSPISGEFSVLSENAHEAGSELWGRSGLVERAMIKHGSAINTPTPIRMGTELQATVIQQVSGAIAKLADGKVELRLDPPELGRVTISFSSTDSGVSAQIVGEKQDIVDLLRRHAEIFSRELTKNGISGAALEFSFQDTGGEGEPQGATKTTPGREHTAIEYCPPEYTDTLASDGLDIRL